ncbi:chromosome partitioning protein [Spongiactinospora gelatinilytica]|uniref:Chromosome partitioning protein n=1 Tax=Spongiactinospora gelatinilytica TaxID=2666298 RepID=A0A2W2EC92_9ACTN|nr:septum site-determining protein Ssd [Spongiactinospora gelatinilytica]PZG20143.1 chromosome partitioning protein [Spongiactinospora gelatinilytica]
MIRPLVITEDRDLLDDLLRISAAAGTELDVAHSPAHARPYWTRAPVVVVGADAADALASCGPPPRSRVLLVTREGVDPDTFRRCVAVGAQAVLELPAAERRLVDEFADVTEPGVQVGLVVCVVGGSGGVGASVFSAALARAAARRRLRTLLLDADPLGGGIDVIVAGEDTTGARWSELVAREGRVNPGALQAVLPAFGELFVLAFDRGVTDPVPPEAMRSVLESAKRGFDLIVVDLPRHLDAAATEALIRATTTVILVRPDVRGALAADQVLGVLRSHAGDIRAIIRPGLVGDAVITSSLDLPSAGTLPDQPRLSEHINDGHGPPVSPKTPLGQFCTSFLDAFLVENGTDRATERGHV